MPNAIELNINTAADATALAQTIFGNGVTVTNATLTGATGASATYSGADATLGGIAPGDSGIILSTGQAADFTNSDGTTNTNTTESGASTDNAAAGDALLDGVTGQVTQDAVVLETTFTTTGDYITMLFTFSSEEYLEYVNGGVNDAFGVWVNNVYVPFSPVPGGVVSIDTVNNVSASNLYLDNPVASDTYNTEMDGTTQVLSIKAPVSSTGPNTLRIALADGGDGVYDTNVLIAANSVQTIALAFDDTVAVEPNTATTVDVLANDIDNTGAGLTITEINGTAVIAGQTVTLPTGAQITLNADNTLTILSDGDLGSEPFTYMVTDGAGNSDVGFVTITTEADIPLNYIVEGTSGNDTIGVGYALDPQGDMIDAGDALDGSNNDSIQAGAGNDVVFAELGDDTIDAGTGSDSVLAGLGNDSVIAGDGNDTVFGQGGNDTLLGGEGADSLDGDDGSDSLDGGGGNDTLIGDAGNDTLLGGAGNDEIYVSTGNNYIDGGADNDLIFGGDLADTILGGTEMDTISGGAGNDSIDGGADADSLSGGVGDDTILGGSGMDTISGGDGADSIDGGDDADILNGFDGNDTVIGGAGNDSVYGGAGDDSLLGGTGNDSMEAWIGNDTLDGGDGDDYLDGADGDDLLIGGAGNDTLLAGNGGGQDTLIGGAGNDSLSSGDGNDTLFGGIGDDTYIGAGGDDLNILEDNFGNDVIVGGETEETTGDTLDLSAVTGPLSIDLTAANPEAGTVSDGTGTATFSEIENIVLGGGVDTLILADGSGNDTVQGFAAPTVDGLGVWTGIDQLDVSGMTDASGAQVNTDDVTVAPTTSGPAGTVLTFPNGESITLLGVPASTFSDPAALEAIGIPLPNYIVEGTTGDDLIDASYLGDPQGDLVDANDNATGTNADSIVAGAGDDSVFSGAGDDTVYGDEGNDLLQTGTGDDLIFGGIGNDTINAENGNDTIFAGDGDDFVGSSIGSDSIDGGAGNDTLNGGGFSGSGGDTIDGGTGNDVISGGGGFDSLIGGSGSDELSGGADDDTLVGGIGDDTLFGGTGDDLLDGEIGNDTLAGGTGADTIDGAEGDDVIVLEDGFGNDSIDGGQTTETTGDTLDLSATTTGVTVDLSGANPENGTVSDGTDTATFIDIENIVLGGGADTVVLADGSGNDTVAGFTAPTVDGLGNWTGVDQLDVSGMTDANGAPVNTDDVTVTDTNGDGTGDAILTFPNGESITLLGVPASTFSDPAALEAIGIPLPNYIVEGTTGDDLIDASYLGDPQGDLVDANDNATGTNADSIVAGAGNDTVLSGVGDDTVDAGDGNDSVVGGAGNDSLLGGIGNDTMSGGLDNDTVAGGDGADWLYGNDGADSLSGGADNDLLYGGTGADTLSGDTGDDYLQGDAGADLLIGGDGSDNLNGGDDNDTLLGGTGGDNMDGGAGADSLEGGIGNDSMWGGSGNDTLSGGDGVDAIYAGTGDDSVDGGAGGDYIQLDAGNDTVLAGDDSDVINIIAGGYADGAAVSVDGGSGGVDNDTLNLSSWTYYSNLVETPDADGNSTSGSVDLEDAAGNIITVTFSEIETLLLPPPAPNYIVEGTSGDDNINAAYLGDPEGDQIDNNDALDGSNDDSVEAGAGNDTVSSGAGNDTINAGEGDDYVVAGSDDDLVFGEAGNDVIFGFDGNDTLLGGDGSDIINGMTGADLIDGGADNDTIVIEDGFGADTVFGGEGVTTGTDFDVISVNTVSVTDPITVDFSDNEQGTLTDGTDTLGFFEIEQIQLGNNNDTVNGAATTTGINIDAMGGDDSVLGGSGDDTIDGGTGNDSIIGGQGADSVTGGAGNDTVEAAQGDTITGGDGDDLFTLVDLGDAGAGTITITGGEGLETGGDTLDLNGQADRTTLNITVPAGVAGGQSGTVQLLDGTIVSFSEIENIICFVPGTMIATQAGLRKIEDLRVGDPVITQDNGIQRIGWIGKTTVSGTGRFAPVHFDKSVWPGATDGLTVSPQHRMLFKGYQSELLFGRSEVLVPALHMIDDTSVVRRPCESVTYIHIMFQQHEIIFANGTPAESYHPASFGVGTLADEAREELFALFPELRSNVTGYGDTARMSLTAREAKVLADFCAA